MRRGFFKLTYCGDLRFKQCDVIEFLVANREPTTKIHKGLKNICSVVPLDKSNVSRWVSRIADSEKSQEELSDAPRCG